jgi:DNA-binding NarL/FixJ family response regulator
LIAPEFLIVEDHPLTAEGIKQQIKACSSGEVLIAESLADAKDVLKSHQPAVMVIDMALPDGDGIEFLARWWQATKQSGGFCCRDC